MEIPEHQLKSWSARGAQQASAETYNSIKAALAAHSWPRGMDHNVYLQGSYPNFTNIRGDSDVDIAVETSNVFYHDVPHDLRLRLGLTGGGAYGWRAFRDKVKTALTSYYGHNAVTDSRTGKCLKVSGKGNRLKADVVPCVTFKHYVGTSHTASGITFWTKTGVQIINYPKLHLENGSRKNSACGGHYKSNIRVFKNARNVVDSDFPSYFLECMLYNVPTNCFSRTHSNTFLQALQVLISAKNDGSLKNFLCQNEQQRIFGGEPHQTSLESAHSVISGLVHLWNNWK